MFFLYELFICTSVKIVTRQLFGYLCVKPKLNADLVDIMVGVQISLFAKDTWVLIASAIFSS